MSACHAPVAILDGYAPSSHYPLSATVKFSERPFYHVAIMCLLQSEHVAQLVMIPGIITAASKPRHAPSTVTAMCRDCRLETKFNTVPGVGITLPRVCTLSAGAPGMGGAKCSLDPWVILPSKSQFADQQTLKLQVRVPFKMFYVHLPTLDTGRCMYCVLTVSTDVFHFYPLLNAPCIAGLMVGPCSSTLRANFPVSLLYKLARSRFRQFAMLPCCRSAQRMCQQASSLET